MNEVETNQVLVSFGTDEETNRVISEVQSDGTCWCSGTTWKGRVAMRISVTSARTTERDIRDSLDAILKSAQRHMVFH